MSGGACSDDRPLLSEPPNPMPAAIPVENWLEAERVVRGVVWRIRPTNRSEERRREVVRYVQGVIRSRLGSEVFPFGSVPLKTYLPDGDIDLTALAPSNIEESLAVNVRALLEEEERRNCTTFEVRDVQYIHAEVKLVKCLVQNIVVDISFNQVGGLCTLCFLEQVDNLIGKDHLFKRSIILIKAWCYYESRILGAHHGLISTYALETLILYIFHLFHSSLDGPIAVLYRFLEYFSKFDWDKFCISLRGRVPISSLPEILAEVPTVPEVDGGDLLLSPEFLDRCVDLFSAPHRVPENNRVFAKKYLNIVDPLKEYNNLGRSVSKGNLYRIRSAFAYGARKLGQILLHRECMRDELGKFFKNTLERHGEGQRPDVQGDYNDFSDKGIPSLNSQNGNSFDKLGSLTISQSHNIVYDKSQSRLYENGMGLEVHQASELQDEDHFKEQYLQPCSHVKREKSKDSKENLASLAGDITNAPGTCEKFDPRVTASTCEYSTTRSDKGAVAVTGNRINHAPHLFFSHSNGSDMASSGASDKSPMHSEACIDIVDVEAHWKGSTAVTDGQGSTPDAYDLADLSGEHERHLKNLQYSQWCHEYFLNGCVSSGKQFFSPSLLNKQQWDAISQRDIFRNGLVQSSPFSRVLNYYQMGPNLASGSYNMEESLKPRGTGMYLTNMNYKMYRDPAESPGKGRNMFSTIPGPRSRNSGPTMTYSETYSADLSGHDRTQYQVNESAPARDLFVNVMSPVKRNSPLEVEGTSGGVGPAPSNNPSLIPGKLESEDVQGPSATSPAQQPLESPSYRRSGKSYRLKDDDEFPPLSNKGQHQSRTVWEVRK